VGGDRWSNEAVGLTQADRGLQCAKRARSSKEEVGPWSNPPIHRIALARRCVALALAAGAGGCALAVRPALGHFNRGRGYGAGGQVDDCLTDALDALAAGACRAAGTLGVLARLPAVKVADELAVVQLCGFWGWGGVEAGRGGGKMSVVPLEGNVRAGQATPMQQGKGQASASTVTIHTCTVTLVAVAGTVNVA